MFDEKNPNQNPTNPTNEPRGNSSGNSVAPLGNQESPAPNTNPPEKVEDIFSDTETRGETAPRPRPPSGPPTDTPPSGPAMPTPPPLDELGEEPAGGGKKIFIIIAVVVLGIIIIGGGGYLWFQSQSTNDNSNLSNVNEETSLNQANTNLNQNLNLNTNLNSNLNTNQNTNQNANQNTNQTTDTDHDGLTDQEEIALGTDIKSADTDGDELSDYDEVKEYNTDPLDPDTDNDGYMDGMEVRNNFDPNGPGALKNINDEIKNLNNQPG